MPEVPRRPDGRKWHNPCCDRWRGRGSFDETRGNYARKYARKYANPISSFGLSIIHLTSTSEAVPLSPLGNYMFLDSQDIGGIDKTPLRQVDNWLLGRMREAHEVERFTKQVLGVSVRVDEVQTLKIGHFIAVIGDQVRRVYVLPAGVSEETGIKVAKGQLPVEAVSDIMGSLKGVPFKGLQVEELPFVAPDPSAAAVNPPWYDSFTRRLNKLEKEVAALERH